MAGSEPAASFDLRRTLPRLRCGWARRPDRTDERDFRTSEYALVWLESGTCRLEYPGESTIDLHAGDAFKRLPDRLHHVHWGRDCATWFLAVPHEVCALLETCGVPGWAGLVLHLGREPWIPARFRAIRNGLRMRDGNRTLRTLALMLTFLDELHRQAQAADPLSAPILEACRLLREEPDMPIPTVARRCGMAYATFRLRFHQMMGCPAAAYRIRRRIEKAQALLAEDAGSLTAIAHRLGYCDAFSFSSQFKQLVGESPNHWRRRVRASS